MQTELPTILNVFETDYELRFNAVKATLPAELFMTGNDENCVTTVTVAIWQSPKDNSRCAIL